MSEELIVIGNGMVGWRFLKSLYEKGGMNQYRVTVFCEEIRPAYDRVHLSEYFTHKDAEQLSLAPEAWYDSIDVKLIKGDSIISIDRDEKMVESRKGISMGYDRIVLATGSSAFIPPIDGIDEEGVFPYRTIEDLEQMISYGAKCKSAAVIGGGLLGLEAAKALVDMNLEAHVVEFAPRLMPRQIDDAGSKMLQSKISELGVEVHLSKATQKIEGGDQGVSAMAFSDGTMLDVDMVVVSAGIRPRDELATQCGLEVGSRGGIVVNNRLQTSDPNIYAIGECALHDGMIYGLVAPGYRMAEAVATQLIGDQASFEGMDMSTKLKLMGVDVGSIGDPFIESDKVRSVVVMNETTGIYKKLVTDVESGALLGAILVGDTDEYGTLMGYYTSGKACPEDGESLLVSSSEGVGGGVEDLPDEAPICSCENVNKGQIVATIQDGKKTVPELKACTKAGTGCGSCVSLVSDLLTSELEKSGEAVDKNLCEHFQYTRQELYQLVRATGIKKYDELLGQHGSGLGCEICRPAVGSILASIHNEPVLENRSLQDTNDAFLANIQKNGTYSVVPRCAGGEITPEQLIVIGEVARDFNLYTKITGGQRIDLFGATLEQLPLVWERLIAVGLETGHAYAKALRTIKSCVGSTWCRFGVQDSTTLAIDLENRYKGLRAPHKIKSAVSGCARECAEAQSKDFGVIATEKGWNLYVCGNGGMTPRHADLLISDVDRETLIKIVDRFLMYYVKTADRLTRTATWLNKLPGGLKHLKEVVLEDSLGICEQLEKEMQHIVDTYECEWKLAVENPKQRQRFSHFINNPYGDKTVKFEKVRGQIAPDVSVNSKEEVNA
jgi:nitrite reductase (NADH) large subunit